MGPFLLSAAASEGTTPWNDAASNVDVSNTCQAEQAALLFAMELGSCCKAQEQQMGGEDMLLKGETGFFS